MFWTDWGLKTIQSAWLDGKNVKSLINETLAFVNGLAIDYSNDRLFWLDATYDKMETSNLDGSDRKIVNLTGL